MPHPTHFEAKLVMVFAAQLNLSDNLFEQVQNNVGEKTTGRKLSNILNQKKIRGKHQFHEIDIKNFELKHTNLIETRYWLLGRA